MAEAPENDGEFQIDRAVLVEAFVAESAEVIAAFEAGLLTLERAPDDEETLHAVFRAAHTLKGSASLVGFDDVRDLAHHLESVLDRVRGKHLALSDGLVTLLLRGVDLLRECVTADAEGRAAPPAVGAYREELEGYHRDLRTAARKEQRAQVAAAAPAAQAPAAPGRRAAHSLRVEVAKLDRMVNLSGEIAIARGRLGELLERGEVGGEELLSAHREADRLWLDLQELILQARMVPLGPTFTQHQRTVRDVAARQCKQVRLVLEGEDVEVDTAVVEGIKDPLTHMVRNAVDHGLESPEERTAAGKDACGTITLRAYYEGALVVLEVADDGKGLDRDRILRRAVERGLAAEGAQLSDVEVFDFVFAPGFSTAEAVTDVSGRGVGMDVVRRNVEALRGSVSLASARGQGTTVTLRFPLTLAIIQGFRVQVGGEVYILPLDAVAECVELPPGNAQGRTGVLDLRGQPLPFLRLRDQFGVGGAVPRRENVVVVAHAGTRIGLAVDGLLGESQTVIKPLGKIFGGVRGVSGSAILGDGRVALILDVAGLIREALRSAPASPPTPRSTSPQEVVAS